MAYMDVSVEEPKDGQNKMADYWRRLETVVNEVREDIEGGVNLYSVLPGMGVSTTLHYEKGKNFERVTDVLLEMARQGQALAACSAWSLAAAASELSQYAKNVYPDGKDNREKRVLQVDCEATAYLAERLLPLLTALSNEQYVADNSVMSLKMDSVYESAKYGVEVLQERLNQYHSKHVADVTGSEMIRPDDADYSSEEVSDSDEISSRVVTASTVALPSTIGELHEAINTSVEKLVRAIHNALWPGEKAGLLPSDEALAHAIERQISNPGAVASVSASHFWQRVQEDYKKNLSFMDDDATMSTTFHHVASMLASRDQSIRLER